jgi:hypothetical protein
MRGLYRSDFGNARYVNALAKRHRPYSLSRPVEVLCASPAALVRAKRQSVPQVRQTLGVPRAVFNRFAPRPARWSPSREGETCCVTFHRWGPKALGNAPVTGAISAEQPSQASGRADGTPEAARLGPPGPRIASPMQGHSARPPLPAPRLETLIKRPSVSGRDTPRNISSRNKVKNNLTRGKSESTGA